jgi:hypothetical protein
MSYKPFSTSLYATNDSAKELVIDWLKRQNIDAWVNPDQYGIDVLSKDEFGVEHSWEVEVKHNWRGPRFPFNSVHFSGRKKKFIKDPSSVSFVMLNSGRTHLLVVKGQDLASADTVSKDTIYTSNEQFIEIPVTKCAFFEVNNG